MCRAVQGQPIVAAKMILKGSSQMITDHAFGAMLLVVSILTFLKKIHRFVIFYYENIFFTDFTN